MKVASSNKVNQLTPMTWAETRATGLLASLFSLRMLGLFMLLPVLTIHMSDFPDANAQSVGFTLGVYGLAQAIFQIPFGMVSDRIGRKSVIVVGLFLLALGSVIALQATSLMEIALGRAIQGAGAIGSTVLASISDCTRENVRARAMAIIGISIGLSFGIAMILGPVLDNAFGLSGVFGFTLIFAVLAMILSYFHFPKTQLQCSISVSQQSVLAALQTILKNKKLNCLNISIAALHASFSACFLFIPNVVAHLLKPTAMMSWQVYAPALLGAALCMAPFVRRADKTQQLESILLVSIVVLALSVLVLSGASSLVGLYVGLILFFASFSVAESLLPALVSRLAPTEQRGAALGVYSTAQFLGIFLGGAIGGIALECFGLCALTLWCMILILFFIGAIGYVKRYK